MAWIKRILLGIGAAAVVVLLVGGLVAWLWPEGRSDVARWIAGPPAAPPTSTAPQPAGAAQPAAAASTDQDPWSTVAGQELQRANEEHWYIALPLTRCFREIDLSDTQNVPGQVTVAFMLGQMPDGSDSWGASAAHPPEFELTNYQRSVLLLSHSIARARAQLAAAADAAQTKMVRYQWCIVIVGALTTILVSIKSMSQGQSRPYFVVGIMAVVFSAAGTAVSSMNSFDSPNASFVKTERGLVQLRQLHLDLALMVFVEKDNCSGMETIDADAGNSGNSAYRDERAKRLADMTNRLKEILATSGFGGEGVGAAPETAGGSSGHTGSTTASP